MCHRLVLSSPTLMMHGHTNLKYTHYIPTQHSPNDLNYEQ